MPEIAILTDASDSMKTRDVAAETGVISRQQWLAQEVGRQFWRPLQAGAKVSMDSFSAPSTNENTLNGTDLDSALEGAFTGIRISRQSCS